MAFTNSPLVSYTKISPNRTRNRNHAIDTITIHCVVGQCTVQTLGNIFAPTSRQASSNYGVGYEGSIGMYVEEKDRSWCTSSASNDHRAITIEVASDSYHPYAVTQAAYEATIKLVADICKRNGIKKLKWSTNKSERMNHSNGCNMTVHRDYANKSCPGDYLYERMGDIANRVNALLGSAGPEPTPEPAPSGKVSVGDVVDFLGGAHYSSSNATKAAAGNLKAGPAKVTQIYNGKHPYHLIHTDSSCAVYGWVNANQIKQLQEPEEPKEYKVGDIVQFKGGAHYSSSNATKPASTSLKAGPAKVTQIYNGKHPYHVVHTDSSSAVYGWVDADQIGAKNPSGGSTSKTIKVGDKVTVRNGAKTYTGGGLASFVYKTTYDVIEVKGDRVVIGLGKAVTAAVKMSDLTKVG